jgi:2-dehydropantoate 2-reductase
MRFGEVEGTTRPGGSTLQSLVRGATTLEGDDLNGEVVLLGRLHGVATPVNAMLQRLARQLVAERIPPGSLPLAELERLV